MYGKIVGLCPFYISLLLFFQAKNDPFKKEPSKKEAEDKAGSSKSSDKRSSIGIKWTNKWVIEQVEKLTLCWIESTLILLFSLHIEHSHLTKKKTRNQINFQKKKKIYPRNRRPKAENLSLFHPTWDKILRRKMTESMGVGFKPLPIINLENPIQLFNGHMSVLTDNYFLFL